MKIAFVCPRYGIDISGGASVHVKWLAEHLAKDKMFSVEVLTTCARDHFRWENYYEPGVQEIGSITVRKFKVNKRDDSVFLKIQDKITTGMKVSYEEQMRWARESVNSNGMYDYIDKNRNKYDYFIFIPYMFGTTVNGSKICPEKSLLIPTLHDEIYAYLDIFKEVFRRFRGIMFSTDPEKQFGEKLYGLDRKKTSIVALGFEQRENYSGKRFSERYDIKDDFCLYVGRKEGGKNTPLLVNYFSLYKKHNKNNLKLVFIGSGDISIPDDGKEDILDMGYLSSADKYDAHSGALCLCQPSVNESLSITIMESWLAGVPVLVNADCAVTQSHCLKSNGGLFFSNYFDFEECMNYFLENPPDKKQMGVNGKKYVKENYNWDSVILRFKTSLQKFR